MIKAVDGVSLSVGFGETLGLVGESGSGKTTLGRLIVGLDQPDSGTIHFLGEDLLAGGRRRRRRRRYDLQMVFQNPYGSLNPRFTVGEVIREPLIAASRGGETQQRERVVELLTEVGLQPDDAGRFPHQFSGGQRQRIAIARGLAARPSLIVCDEAVSALDVSVQAQIINLLQDLQEVHGVSYLFISHDLRVVRQLSSQIAVMYRGQIVESGAADQIYNEPSHPYTKRLLKSMSTI